jgi:hypothetical protein
MMLPTLVLVGIGRSRCIWIPIPAILLWPFWALGWVVWVVFRVLRVSWEMPLRTALLLSLHLSGFKVDIHSNDGGRTYVRMI